jgi:hypothetical protein
MRSTHSTGAISHSDIRNNLNPFRSKPAEFESNPASYPTLSSSEILSSGLQRVVDAQRPLLDPLSSHHPINNFLNDDNSPWVALSHNQLNASLKTSASSHAPVHQFDNRTYRTSRSELGSIAAGHCASDSGYNSRTEHSRSVATQSVRSAEIADHQSEFTTDIVQQLSTFQPFTAMPGSSPGANSENPEDRNSRSPSRSRGGQRTCERCHMKLKCPSDLKYVSITGFS